MKNTIIKVVAGILIITSLMFAEYRFIMLNIRPYLGERNTVYIEMFGRMEEYYADNIEDYNE